MSSNCEQRDANMLVLAEQLKQDRQTLNFKMIQNRTQNIYYLQTVVWQKKTSFRWTNVSAVWRLYQAWSPVTDMEGNYLDIKSGFIHTRLRLIGILCVIKSYREKPYEIASFTFSFWEFGMWIFDSLESDKKSLGYLIN